MNFKDLLTNHPKFALLIMVIQAIKDFDMRLSTVLILVAFIFGTPLIMLADFASLMLG